MTAPQQEPEADPTADAVPPGMPRWVKVPLIVVAALLLIFVILQFTGVGGQHGPARHQGASPIPTQAGFARLGGASHVAL